MQKIVKFIKFIIAFGSPMLLLFPLLSLGMGMTGWSIRAVLYSNRINSLQCERVEPARIDCTILTTSLGMIPLDEETVRHVQGARLVKQGDDDSIYLDTTEEEIFYSYVYDPAEKDIVARLNTFIRNPEANLFLADASPDRLESIVGSFCFFITFFVITVSLLSAAFKALKKPVQVANPEPVTSPGQYQPFRLSSMERPGDQLWLLIPFLVLLGGLLFYFIRADSFAGFLAPEGPKTSAYPLLTGVIIGLLLAYLTARQLSLWVAAGDTIVEVSTQPFRPGQTIQVYLSHRPGRIKPQQVQVSLVCQETTREETTYTSKGRTRTKYIDKHREIYSKVVHRQIPADRGDWRQTKAVKMPNSVKSSVETDYPKIRWRLVVKTILANAPDFIQKFPVDVQESDGGRSSQATQAWQAIARANKLTFSKGGYAEERRVSGAYRGYAVELRPVRRAGQPLKTRLVLTAGADISPEPDIPSPSPDQPDQSLAGDAATHLLDQAQKVFSRGKIWLEKDGWALAYEQPSLETDVDRLQTLFDTLVDLKHGYPDNIALAGGEIVLTLQEIVADKTHPLHPIALHLLEKTISATHHLADQPSQFVCQRCFHRCTSHEAELPADEFRLYYGCRACRQSRAVQPARLITAVLDSRPGVEPAQTEEDFRVNWLAHRELFDFEAVEIIRATDEDVERFAVQVGNDTDPARRSRYRQMPCLIRPDCDLSQNTRRILRQIFEQVQ